MESIPRFELPKRSIALTVKGADWTCYQALTRLLREQTTAQHMDSYKLEFAVRDDDEPDWDSTTLTLTVEE